MDASGPRENSKRLGSTRKQREQHNQQQQQQRQQPQTSDGRGRSEPKRPRAGEQAKVAQKQDGRAKQLAALKQQQQQRRRQVKNITGRDSQRARAVPKASGAPMGQDGNKVDWSKLTHFRAGRSVKDLESLQRRSSKANANNNKLLDPDKPDKTGLWPIHWAAINNRSDMIEFMLKEGARADRPCQNRLFANGTPLHLAAMNGSLEAAAALLEHAASDSQTSTSSSEETGNDTTGNDTKEHKSQDKSQAAAKEKSAGGDLLSQRDAEGQTPLMRTAAHRSKRLDTIRDLLRKNFWSLSGRPAEMALYLICKGARWRDTEPTSGMNLLHLAIVNDYDDIVGLMLVLDRQLLDVAAASIHPDRNEQALPRTASIALAADGFETIELNEVETLGERPEAGPEEAGVSRDSSANSTPSQEVPLIKREERSAELLANGLKPLQLAILYGRISAISQLWHAREGERARSLDGGGGGGTQAEPNERPTAANSQLVKGATRPGPALKLQRRAIDEHSLTRKQLKAVLLKACWTSREELGKFAKATLLKSLLALDLGLVALLWAPLYAGADERRLASHGLRGGLFLLSFSLSLALAFRVMLKNPGYLRRNSLQYLSLMSALTHDLSQSARGSPSSSSPATPAAAAAASKPLIKLDSGANSGASSPDAKAPAQTEQSQAAAAPTTQQTGSGAEKSEEERRRQLQLEVLARSPSWPPAKLELKDAVRLLCHKCQCVRRPRSRHCNYCNHCVQDFDHHCIYLGCCIGRQNRLDFLLALLATTVTGAYGAFLIASGLGQSDWSSFWQVLAFVWVLKYAFLGLILAFQNARRACLGVTMYEEIRSKRIRHLFGRYGPPAGVSKTHGGFSTLKSAFWRYDPDRFVTGDLTVGELRANFAEFTNGLACDEYLLALFCTDTPLARAIASSDSRTINTHNPIPH